MQQQIESVILSNVGNRLTQELAYGLIMSVTHLAQQAVESAVRTATAGGGDIAGAVGEAHQQPTAAQPPVAGQATAYVDPAYVRTDADAGAPPSAEKPQRVGKARTARKARQ